MLCLREMKDRQQQAEVWSGPSDFSVREESIALMHML